MNGLQRKVARVVPFFSALQRYSSDNYGSRTPMRPPMVCIEDYTLTFTVNHPDFTLTVKDEDDAVVYTTMVFSAQTEVILPPTLSGDYEIQLTMGN